MNIWVYALVIAVLLFQLVAIPALWLKKNDLADVLWGPAFPISASLALWLSGTPLSARASLALLLVWIWALRLVVHVGARNLATTKEDVRYNNWRQQWGSTQVWRSYLQVFVLQPLILYVFLVPLLLLLATPEAPLNPLAYLGAALWLAGFLFESIGDEQLRRFKKNPANKGKLITSGLWSWSRHPNYFGEVLLWWGIWLMCADLPYGWAAVIGPIGVSYLLWSVSGVAMTEALMKRRDGFEEYARRTSIFFPLPPAK